MQWGVPDSCPQETGIIIKGETHTQLMAVLSEKVMLIVGLLWESWRESLSQGGKGRLTKEFTLELNIEGGAGFLKGQEKAFQEQGPAWDKEERWKSTKEYEWLCMTESERRMVGDTTQQGKDGAGL